jgi:bacteriorhodopsin
MYMSNNILFMEKLNQPKQEKFATHAMIIGGLAITAYVAMAISSGNNTIKNTEFDSEWLNANSTPSVLTDGVEQE